MYITLSEKYSHGRYSQLLTYVRTLVVVLVLDLGNVTGPLREHESGERDGGREPLVTRQKTGYQN